MYQIWIDTGGTFTDCIGIDPQGNTQRVKVLSSSFLRGNIVEQVAANAFKIQTNWNFDLDLILGFSFRLIGHQSFVKIVAIQEKTIIVSEAIEQKNAEFEITTHEEAPILATRIITKTPLGKVFPKLSMRLGTTKGTNALLERKGAKVTLLVTKGFKDLLRIGTQQRPNLFQLDIPEPTLLYDKIIEVQERIGSNGEVLQELDENKLQNLENESIAISFLNSYKNSKHEKKIAKRLPNASVSSELSPTIGYLKRTQTALVNAYLQPILNQYLTNITTSLGGQAVQVMSSSGGLVVAESFDAKDSLLSGPAGGMVGAAHIAQRLGFDRCLTFDMGGTSTDTARFDGKLDLKFTTKIDDIELHNPTLAIETVAAGGGSICTFDGHKLVVGPESAGANPGPACYGAGGPLTITDVNLLLGKIDASQFGIPVKIEKAVEALAPFQRGVPCSPFTAKEKEQIQNYVGLLYGLEQIANEKMAEAIRKISVGQGFDPKEYPLLAFGGAGGLHGCQLAEILGIQTVILPFDAGLLSAFGIGKANIERIGSEQLLKELSDCAETLAQSIERIAENLKQQLKKKGIEQCVTKAVLLYLRFKGQENVLELKLGNLFKTNEISDNFKSKYASLFGYCPDNLAIEVESVKVIVGEIEDENTKFEIGKKEKKAQSIKTIQPVFEEKNIDVYNWTDLETGDFFTGPAVLLNATSTSYIPENWEALVTVTKDVVISWKSKAKKSNIQANEAVELELFTNRFMAIAEEMGAQLQRTAFSVNVKERLDFSCALLDTDAELLVNAPHIPVHLGSLGVCARLVKQKLSLEAGDVIITNHPKFGGSHLPDVTLLSGVFTPDNRLIGYAINRAHHAEIGGKTPGSMPPDATTLIEEGVVIEPTYLVRKGQMEWERVLELFTDCRYPTRALTENVADINAALASLKTAELALQKLVAEHGLEKVHFYMNRLKETAFEALQSALEPYKNQVLEAEELMDDGRKIKVKIEIDSTRSEGVIFDFTGTFQRHTNNLNANISIIYSVVLYVLRILVNKNIPLNEGLLRGVALILPDDSFLHPNFPEDSSLCPAVVGGNTEVSQRLTDTLLKAFGLAACSQGTMNNLLFGNEKFGYYETICGGTGATENHHGRSAVHQHMTNTKITDPEELERKYPVRLHRFEIRENSGGKGQFDGGDGVVREIGFLEDLKLTLISQHRQTEPYGLNGGEAGQCGKQTIVYQNGQTEITQGIFSKAVSAGDRLILETPGGGGWGGA